MSPTSKRLLQCMTGDETGFPEPRLLRKCLIVIKIKPQLRFKPNEDAFVLHIDLDRHITTLSASCEPCIHSKPAIDGKNV